MKKSVSFLLIVSIIVVGSFSLLAFASHSDGDGLCPVATINGSSGICAKSGSHSNDFAAVFYYLSGMSNFFNVIVLQMALISFLVVFFSIVFLTVRFIVSIYILFSRIIIRRVFVAYRDSILGSTRSFTRWIARLNKCDFLSI